MKIHTYDTLQLSASIVAIGGFDGVHKGHQKLIDSARRHAEKLQLHFVVYTFDPPPRVFFQEVRLLTPLPEKLNRLRRLGVQHVVIAPFDTLYASRKAEEFHDELQKLNPLGIWVGNNFKYGVKRKGNVDLLKEEFAVHILEPVRCASGEIISSSRIRKLFEDKIQSEAKQLLGWD
ncbi:FAD synthetase family protein [Neobacillus drentensis]|uniref:FAD synthetase family protein n=1 Tax=Neobacillus drentensis TaxID=220684 RepID=UPI000824323D|nr:FAD synthetase family protein [Neobacillus drentensis]